ncbi:MAG: Protein of unknown function DUF262 [Candidatus Kentron sp. G]|nr:MAG: Protein of unknown function DUF262 [Candidatus Kentron sp. G]VFN01247.1 MAG: Protein of unknown function DUF262 [Candidatus Kentron sp. G]VFN02892.1 MAG: Protein of unknown function DUF262 [Candidatus Kentron sp. G]
MPVENIEAPEVEITDDIPDPDGEDPADASIMEEPFNPASINVVPKQDALSNLIVRLRNDEIDMNTEFQRHADLWDIGKMSRLIESILIRFPLPAFYFDATNDEKWLIVDGLQRLSSIRKFVIEENEERKLRLRGLEYLAKDLEGKTYEELSRPYQRRIHECPVTLFLIQPGTPEEVKYSIFRRINTGGLTLTDQEIRNAMATPRLRAWLERLAKDEYLIKTIGDQSKRMVDQELVLRFLAFYSIDYNDSKRNIKTFLDEMMKNLESMGEEELNELESAFRVAIRRCWELFENSAFQKITDNAASRRRRTNATLFEVWMVALAKLSIEEADILVASKKYIKDEHFRLISSDNDYFRAISFSTQKKEHFRIRHDKVEQLIKSISSGERLYA